MSKREKFLESARSQVNKGIYVWGGNGENLLTMDDPEAWIRKKETSKENAERAINLFAERVENGVDPIRAFDCSGLVYWSQKEAGVGYGDMTANSLWKNCDPVDELQAGDLVFHHNGLRCTHVGIYNGDGFVIEAIGRDLGVVLNRRVDEKYWNRWGRLKKMPIDPEPKPEPTDAYVLVKGRSVYVRNVDYVPDDKKLKKESVIGVAHRGETYRLISTAPSGWHEIDFKGQIGFISNRPDLTEVVSYA
jgi:hypothetical protein